MYVRLYRTYTYWIAWLVAISLRLKHDFSYVVSYKYQLYGSLLLFGDLVRLFVMDNSVYVSVYDH